MDRPASATDQQVISAGLSAVPPVMISTWDLQRWRKAKILRSPGVRGTGTPRADYSPAEVDGAVTFARHVKAPAPTLTSAAAAAINDGATLTGPAGRTALIDLLASVLDPIKEAGDDAASELAEGVAADPRPGKRGRRFKSVARSEFSMIQNDENLKADYEDPSFVGEQRSRARYAGQRSLFTELAAKAVIAPLLGDETSGYIKSRYRRAGLLGMITPHTASLFDPGDFVAAEEDFDDVVLEHSTVSDLETFATDIDSKQLSEAAEDFSRSEASTILGLSDDAYDPVRLLAPLIILWGLRILSKLDPTGFQLLLEVGLEGEHP